MPVPFKNLTDAGNEKALRRGRTVPDDAVNIAYVQSPTLSPQDNIVIVDTSRIVEENVINLQERRKLYFANSLGVLQDEQGNEVIDDEFPYVTDIFSIDEDRSDIPGSEYRTEHILPFLHISRHFHLDWAGQTLPGDLVDWKEEVLKVTDREGRVLLTADGKPRYKVKLAEATATPHVEQGQQSAYRVYVYVDSDLDNELYLTYNKVEVGNDGIFKNQRINYKELLNLRPVFEYAPEESEVVDRAAFFKKVYSTKPVTLARNNLGVPTTTVDGYRVYVPRKAKGDPRIFQLFHWRVNCEFISEAHTDTIKFNQTVYAGILCTTENTTTAAPYAFLNLEKSNKNSTKVKFENPLKTGNNIDKASASYWMVDIKKVSLDDLKKFDILIWAPTGDSMDFTDPITKLNHFVSSIGGTVFIDTSGLVVPINLGPNTTAGVHAANGVQNSGTGGAGTATTASVTVNNASPLMDSLAKLGGWNLLDGQNNDEIQALSYIQQVFNPGYTQYITSLPSDWETVVWADGKSVTAVKYAGTGKFIFSTFSHLKSVSSLFTTLPAATLTENNDASAYTGPGFNEAINSPTVEGAMKLFMNVVLLAVQGRALTDKNLKAFSTSWKHSTPWRSSWVIKGDNGVLSDEEQRRYNFDSATVSATDTTPVLKRKLSNQTCKELIEESLLADPVLRVRQRGGSRNYALEVTNSGAVKATVIPSTGEVVPTAWTTAWSPKFEVPVELGPNVVRSIEREGEWSGTYDYKNKTVAYPDSPYAGQVQTSANITTEQLRIKTVTFDVYGEGVETVPRRWRDPIRIPTQSKVPLTWRNYPQIWTPGPGISQDGERFYIQQGEGPRHGYYQPVGIATWQDHNYKGGAAANAQLNWPYCGFTERYLQGNSGDVVKFIQEAMNAFHRDQFFVSSRGYLVVDGNYGPATTQAIRDFQARRQARFVDGVIDAETWSLIGYQILRGNYRSNGRGGYFNFFDYPWTFLPVDHISDGDDGSVWAKRSWSHHGLTVQAPAAIWDYIQITFNGVYRIHKVTVTPYLAGAANTMQIRTVKISGAFPMINYLGGDAQFRDTIVATNGVPCEIPMGPYDGDTITIGIGQNQPAGAGWGTALMMGIKDISAEALVDSWQTGWSEEKVTWDKYPYGIAYTGTASVTPFVDQTVTIQTAYEPTRPEGTVADVIWSPPTIRGNETGVVATLLDPRRGIIRFQNRSTFDDIVLNDHSTRGPVFPGLPLTEYYSMTVNKELNPMPETGFVSQTEGIKLLCKAKRLTDGTLVPDGPFGFPVMPNTLGSSNEMQRHFATISLVSLGTHEHVTLGFYDLNKNEFIVNAAGLPEMSFIEWQTRGTGDVYISVVSDAFKIDDTQIPHDDDAPKLPYRWAMPVYGICKRSGARITLEPLPPKLGLSDVWPIAVRDGRFSRTIKVRARSEGYITTYLKDYQGTTVRAFYGVPDTGGWSILYGPPMADVLGEQPLILDDDVIQVRQPPVHISAEPSVVPGYPDPVRPVFTVYTRTTTAAPWVAVPWSGIRDYNCRTGEIFLTNPIATEDASLLRVDYTTQRRHYHFKRSGTQLLNLNPYLGQARNLIGMGIYVYVLPIYVKDNNKSVIAASFTEKPIRFTTNPSIFDPLRPEYDPLAVMLGVIYISTALDISQLTLLDTRRRGGGIKDERNANEIQRLVQESATYWDVSHAAGASYQKAGYVVIRLPDALKNDFTEPEIIEAIERNITAGVKFKLETLTGADWSAS